MPYIGNNHIAGDHTNNFKVLDDISSFTATFDGSASSVVDTTNNTIRVVDHRFIQGQRVTYTNGSGGNIGGLTTGTAYFVIFDSASTIKLATSASNAANSTAINLSALGTGSSHTLNVAFDGVNTKFKITYNGGTGARFNNATQLNIAINNVLQKPNVNSSTFTEGFAIEDNHKIVFKIAPTSQDIFWGSIIANTLTTFDISDHKIDTFTGDGSTTEFTLSHTPANNESLMVTINGVLQHPSNASTPRAYTLIASIIQFTAAPGVGDEIQVRHLGFAGATTADVSGFYGRTGNVALTANDHITTGDITARNINASGILTASSANFSGNVSIGGTLTYEDVSNIDSVGIITARDGIDCNGDLDVDGHTNLDNVSVVGISTFSGDINIDDGAADSAAGPELKLNRGSASPANADYLGQIKFAGRSSTGAERNYAKITGKILDVTNGSEDGILEFAHIKGGSQTITGRWRSDSLQLLNGTNLSVAGDTTLTGDLDVDGHTNLDNVSIAGITTFTNGYVNLKPGNGGDAHFRILSTGAGDAGIFFDAANGDIAGSDYVFIGQKNNLDFVINPNANAGNIDFQRAGTTNVRIDSNGRVLFSRGGLTASRNIGTKTGEIQVANSGNSSAITIMSYSNDVGGPHLMFGKSRAGNATGSTILQDGDRLGEIAFCGADGNDIDSFGAAIKAHVDGTPGANDMPGRLQFYTTSDGGSSSVERLRITSSGRVFIGETSVAGSAKLVVGNGGAENFEFTPGNSTYNGGLLEYIHRGDSNTRPDMNMYIAGAGAFKVYTNGANERLRIASDGKLLVGKTSGSAKVDVDASNSTLRLTKANATDYVGFQLDRDNSNNAGGYLGLAGALSHYISGSAQHDLCLRSQSNLLFSSGGNIERLRINSSGNVLIGTTSATAEFTVRGGGTVAAFEGTGGSGAIAIRDADAGTYVFLKDDGGVFHIQTSGNSYSDKFSILTSGYVGINETSPSSQLHVKLDGLSNNAYNFRTTYLSGNNASGYTASGITLTGTANNSSGDKHTTFINFNSRDPALNGNHGAGAYIAMSNPDSQGSYGTGQLDFYIRNGAAYTFPNDPQASSSYWMSSLFTIKSSGNLGVGGATGTDFSLLDGMVINTNNGSAGLIINSSSSGHNAYMSFGYGSGSGTSHADQYSAYIGRVGDNTLILGTDNNIRVRVTSGGHVAIASGQLIMSNDIKSSDDDYYVYSYNGGSDGQVRSGIQYDGSNQRLRFLTATNERARIDSSGNFMIGRTAGQKKLSVRNPSTSSGVHIVQTIGGASHVSGYAVGLGFDPEGYEARTKIAIVAEGISAGYSRGNLHFLLDSNSNGDEVNLNDKKMTITEGGQIGIGQDGGGNVNTRAVLEISAPFNDVSDNDGSAAYTMNNHDAILINYSGASYSSGTNVGSIAWTNGGRRRAAIMAEYQSTDGDIVALSFFTRGTDGAGDFYRSFIINRNGSAGLHGSLSQSTSDDRLKKDKVEITNALDKVNSLSSFTHKWNDIAVRAGLEEDKEEIGLSAQEVQGLYPCLVDVNNVMKDPEDPDTDYLTVHYAKVVPLLVASIKELTAKNKALEARLDALESS